MTDSLFYVADPMCSWCYGFAPQWERAKAELPVPARLVMGGLAPDADEPMPDDVRAMGQGAWRAVEQTTGVAFNHDFWENCAPRRSTYPACRAVIAAEQARAGAGEEMLAAIQRAYYREARNPSDATTLIALAIEIGLEESAFEAALGSSEVRARFDEDLRLAQSLGVRSFPTVVLVRGDRVHGLAQGYDSAERVLARYEALIAD